MALTLLLGSALLAGNLWASENWGPGKRGPIGVTANFGLGRLSDGGTKSTEVDPIRIGAGASYAHPISEMFYIGGFAELRLSFTNLRYGVLSGSDVFEDTGNPGFGFALGPYFRLGLWGANKKGGLAFAPYFALQSLRGAKTDKHKSGGLNWELKTDGILAVGVGARVDVFITDFIGINLGFEVLDSKLKVTPTASRGNRRVSATKITKPLFGPAFYSGVTLSF